MHFCRRTLRKLRLRNVISESGMESLLQSFVARFTFGLAWLVLGQSSSQVRSRANAYHSMFVLTITPKVRLNTYVLSEMTLEFVPMRSYNFDLSDLVLSRSRPLVDQLTSSFQPW
jgi:hypothetical protein